MKEIHIAVRDGIATQTDHTAYITGDGETWAVFDLGEEWDDRPLRTARFQTEGSYMDVAFRGNKCRVPVFTYARKLEVGVYAGNVRTTTPARVFLREGIRSAWGSPETPAPNIYDQLMEMLEDSNITMKQEPNGVRVTVRQRGEEKTAFLRYSEVYVGSGDMPEGYVVQVDPAGGSAVLRVKDQSGRIIPIPSIRGEKGDKGDTGEPGPPGPKGDGGEGAVRSVSGRNPDGDGNVALTAADIGALPLTGGSLTGELNLGGSRITKVAAPTEAADAATKSYVDGRRRSQTATLSTSWSGTGPYTQTLSLIGIQNTDTPHVGPVYASDAETALKQQKGWNKVSFARAGDSKIIFTCLEEKPDTAIPIQIEVVR